MSRLSNLPIIRSIWSYVREKKIIKRHKEVSAFWTPLIDRYFNNDFPKYEVIGKKDLGRDKIIWQYWGQGIQNDLPEVVKACFDSVDRNRKEWMVIRLDDNNISDYLEFPDFVKDKVQANVFNKTFFSDLLRLALLKLYGGVWLDATIYMTGSISQKLASMDYFMYQRSSEEVNKEYWKKSYAYYWNWTPGFKVNVLNSIFFSVKNGVVVTSLLDLMLYYWATQEEVKDYFFFQILYDDLMNGYLKEKRCEVVTDVIPHVLQTKFNGFYPYMTYEQVLQESNLHKMSYFEGLGLTRFRDFNRSQS